MTLLLDKRNLCGLVFDGVVEESHQKTANVTSFPVGINAPISDHMIPQPVTVTIRGLLGDYFGGVKQSPNGNALNSENLSTPNAKALLDNDEISDLLESSIDDLGGITNIFNEDTQASGAITSLQSIVRNVGISDFGSPTSDFDINVSGTRARAAWCRLIELMDNKEVCTLVTGLKKYENMVVSSASTTTDVNAAESCKIDVTINLIQIKRATSQTSTIFQIAGKGEVAKGKKSLGCFSLDQVFNGGEVSARRVGESQDTIVQTVSGLIVAPFGEEDLVSLILNIAEGLRVPNSGLNLDGGDVITQQASGSPSESQLVNLATIISKNLRDAERQQPGFTCIIPRNCNEARNDADDTKEDVSNKSGDKELEQTSVVFDGLGIKRNVADAADQFNIGDSSLVRRSRLFCYQNEIARFLNNEYAGQGSSVTFEFNGQQLTLQQALNTIYTPEQLEQLDMIYAYNRALVGNN